MYSLPPLHPVMRLTVRFLSQGAPATRLGSLLATCITGMCPGKNGRDPDLVWASAQERLCLGWEAHAAAQLTRVLNTIPASNKVVPHFLLAFVPCTSLGSSLCRGWSGGQNLGILGSSDTNIPSPPPLYWSIVDTPKLWIFNVYNFTCLEIWR